MQTKHTLSHTTDSLKAIIAIAKHDPELRDLAEHAKAILRQKQLEKQRATFRDAESRLSGKLAMDMILFGYKANKGRIPARRNPVIERFVDDPEAAKRTYGLEAVESTCKDVVLRNRPWFVKLYQQMKEVAR